MQEPAAHTEINEDLVLLELAAFLSGRDHWPTRQEFIDAGQAQLYQQAQRTGGGERWAPEFGLAYAAEPHNPAEEALRAELAEFLEGFDHWPSFAEFRAASRTTLHRKVVEHGGTKRWAAEFRLPTLRQLRADQVQQRRDEALTQSRRGHRNPRRWTADLVRAELAAFLAGADHFPSETEFIEAGDSGLYRAVLRFGGSERWAAEFNLPRVSDIGRQRARDLRAIQAAAAEERRSERERQIRELEEFCAGRECFPAHSDWIAAGRQDLQNFVHRNGGVREWSARLGLPLRPAHDRRPYDIDRALADGRIVIEQFGRIPNSSELQRAGHGKLWTFIRREFNGDRGAFAALCV